MGKFKKYVPTQKEWQEMLKMKISEMSPKQKKYVENWKRSLFRDRRWLRRFKKGLKEKLNVNLQGRTFKKKVAK